MAVVFVIASLLVVLVAMIILVVKYTTDGRDMCVGERAYCGINELWGVNSKLSGIV